MKHYTIHIFGADAVAIAERFCRGYCYRGIYDHGNYMAQLEPVLDDLVSVAFIKSGADINRVLHQLARLGFSGCECSIEDCTEVGCFCECRTICGTII